MRSHWLQLSRLEGNNYASKDRSVHMLGSDGKTAVFICLAATADTGSVEYLELTEGTMQIM